MWATLIASILTALLPFGIKLIQSFLDKNADENDMKLHFKKFLEATYKAGHINGPAKISQDVEDLDEEADEYFKNRDKEEAERGQ